MIYHSNNNSCGFTITLKKRGVYRRRKWQLCYSTDPTPSLHTVPLPLLWRLKTKGAGIQVAPPKFGSYSSACLCGVDEDDVSATLVPEGVHPGMLACNGGQTAKTKKNTRKKKCPEGRTRQTTRCFVVCHTFGIP